MNILSNLIFWALKHQLKFNQMPKKKKTTSAKNLSGKTETEDFPLSEAEKANMTHLLEQALMRYKVPDMPEKKIKFKEIEHLSSMAEEYLSCFMLLGYSLQNEKVFIFNASSPKDEGALADLLRSTFLDISNNRP